MRVEQLYGSNKLYPNTTKAQEAWRRKNEPEWERKGELVRAAIKSDFLKELSAKQQKAITTIFPENGGHNSVNEAARELNKSGPAVRSTFNFAVKQLERKAITGEFLKKGRPRSRPIEASNGQEKQPTKSDQKRRIRKANADWARANGFLKISPEEPSSRSSREPLSDTQKKVLNAAYPSDGSCRAWKEIKDQFTFSDKRYYQILAAGDRNIALAREGKLRGAGRSKKPGTRESFLAEKYFKESKAILVIGKMGAPKKTVDEKELRFQIAQGKSINQVAVYFHLSWMTMERICEEHRIPRTRARMGRLPKIQQAVSA